MQKPPVKICLIGHSLASGGAERAMASLSRFFYSKGVDVHVITVVDSIQYPYGGTLFNLGKSTSRIAKFLKLRKHLAQHRFDYIIDFRMRQGFVQEWVTQTLLYNAPVFYTVHSARLAWYLPQNRSLARKLYGRNPLVAVSHGIADLLRPIGLESRVIANPLDLRLVEQLSESVLADDSSFILAVGRMDDDVKQFDELIRTYAESTLPAQGIRLVILGDGILRKELKELAKSLKISDSIQLSGTVANPYPYFKNALFTVLSSKNEGLPTVIMESLACGTPVVSFDCATGPSELIRDRENGILVADQDFEALRLAMEQMASDEALLAHCRANAKNGIDSYSLENVGKEWTDLLKIKVS